MQKKIFAFTLTLFLTIATLTMPAAAEESTPPATTVSTNQPETPFIPPPPKQVEFDDVYKLWAAVNVTLSNLPHCDGNSKVERKVLVDIAKRLESKKTNTTEDTFKQDLKDSLDAINKLEEKFKKIGSDREETPVDWLTNPKAVIEALLNPPFQGGKGMHTQPQLKSPFDKANTTLAKNSISIGGSYTNSTNREIKATASLTLKWGNLPTNPYAGSFWRSNLAGANLGTECSEYIVSVDAAYDDKWKRAVIPPDTSNDSTITQTYSGQVINLSRTLSIPTFLSAGMYHDSSQSVVYDFEPALGTFGRLSVGNTMLLGSIAYQGDVTSLYGAKGKTASQGGHFYVYFKTGWGSLGGKSNILTICSHAMPAFVVNTSTEDKWKFCKSIEATAKPDPSDTIAFNFRGFLPFGDANYVVTSAHASAMVEWDHSFTQNWSLSFSVLDSYYATVKNAYNHNSLTPSISLRYSPSGGK